MSEFTTANSVPWSDLPDVSYQSDRESIARGKAGDYAKRVRAYEFEFGAGGNRLGCKFLLDDGSLLFVHDSQITPAIEQLISSLGSPTEGVTQGGTA